MITDTYITDENRTENAGKQVDRQGGMRMNRISEEQIEQARKIGLLTYLKACEPGKLVKISENTYCTTEHDSLKITARGWNWFSRKIHGKTALDYLIKVEGYKFTDAVKTILEKMKECPPLFIEDESESNDELYIQELNPSTDRIEAYLVNRYIDREIIRYCIENKIMFETADFHSILFAGYDDEGIMRFAAQRGTVNDFKGDNAFSEKSYSFNIEADEVSDTVHVFEAPIDLMSFATLKLDAGKDWRSEHMLSLDGVVKSSRSNYVPPALNRFLTIHPEITTVWLHLDNDEAGRNAAESIINGLQDRYVVLDEPPEDGKDMNEYLSIIKSGNKGCVNDAD